MAAVKGTVIKLIKLVLVAGLMWWVFSSVHWQDAVDYRGADKSVEHVVGKIEGSWSAEPVTFRSGQPETVRALHRGRQADGRELDIVPGFLTYWKNLDGWLFALGAFCYFVTSLIASTRWWWLLRVNGMNVGVLEAVRLTWIGTFFNNVVPGQTGGDLIKAIYIMKQFPNQRVPALVSVIVDRVLGLASLAILGAVVVLFDLAEFGAMALAIWGVIAMVLLLGLFAFSRRLRQLIRLKALLNRLPHRIGNLLKLIDEAVFFYRGHKRVIALSLLAGIVNHIVSVASVMFIGQALGIPLPPMPYFVLLPVINIISAVPVAPNGWGIGEALYRALFAKYGWKYVPNVAQGMAREIMGTQGVALSVLYRLHLTLWSLLGGLFVLFEKNRVTREDIQHEVELEEHERDVRPAS